MDPLLLEELVKLLPFLGGALVVLAVLAPLVSWITLAFPGIVVSSGVTTWALAALLILHLKRALPWRTRLDACPTLVPRPDSSPACGASGPGS